MTHELHTNNLASIISKNLFEIFEYADKMNLISPDWIDVNRYKLNAYKEDVLIYSFDRFSATSQNFFHNLGVSDSKTLHMLRIGDNILMDCNSINRKEVLDNLQEYRVSWTI